MDQCLGGLPTGAGSWYGNRGTLEWEEAPGAPKEAESSVFVGR